MVVDYLRDQQHWDPWTFREVMHVYHIIWPVHLLGFGAKVTSCNEISDFLAKTFEEFQHNNYHCLYVPRMCGKNFLTLCSRHYGNISFQCWPSLFRFQCSTSLFTRHFVPVVERDVSPLLWLVIEGQCSVGLLDSVLFQPSCQCAGLWNKPLSGRAVSGLKYSWRWNWAGCETKCLPRCYKCP